MNLFSILEESAAKRPENTAVVHDGRSFSYSELHHAAKSLALDLRAAGVRPGDKVGVVCPNSPEYMITVFAAARTGAVVIPVSTASKEADLIALTDEMAVDVLCYSACFKSLIPEGIGKTPNELSIAGCSAPVYVKLASDRKVPDERDKLVEFDAAIINFSSGTTSRAKGIVLSHATVLQRATASCEIPIRDHRDVVLWLLRADFPTIYARWALLGVKIVLADAFDMRMLARLIAEHEVTHIYATPLSYRMMLNQEDLLAHELAGVKYFVSTGAPLPEAIAEAFSRKLGREISQLYGLTETGAVLANHRGDPHKRGSVGTPLPGCAAQLLPLNVESSRGDVGELRVRGTAMFDAYYKPWRLRDEVLEDGWFRTGDIARRDNDGYYWIVGRTKEVINVAGVKTFPREIEDVLLSHPAVEEAMVFAAAESRFGEVPRAKVKLRAGTGCTEKEILQYASERLSVFKAPRGIEFVDQIPKTATGKPIRWA